MISKIVAHNRLCDGLLELENALFALIVLLGEPTEQNSTREGEISIVQSIQFGFLQSLGSATFN